MPPITLKHGCGRKSRREGLCSKFQAIMFMKNGKEQKLYFATVAEREAYYKSHLQGRKEYTQFGRYSVTSTDPNPSRGKTIPAKRKNTHTRRRKV